MTRSPAGNACKRCRNHSRIRRRIRLRSTARLSTLREMAMPSRAMVMPAARSRSSCTRNMAAKRRPLTRLPVAKQRAKSAGVRIWACAGKRSVGLDFAGSRHDPIIGLRPTDRAPPGRDHGPASGPVCSQDRDDVGAMGVASRRRSPERVQMRASRSPAHAGEGDRNLANTWDGGGQCGQDAPCPFNRFRSGGKTLAALGATGIDDPATTDSLHASTKAVVAGALEVAWLERALHGDTV